MEGGWEPSAIARMLRKILFIYVKNVFVKTINTNSDIMRVHELIVSLRFGDALQGFPSRFLSALLSPSFGYIRFLRRGKLRTECGSGESLKLRRLPERL